MPSPHQSANKAFNEFRVAEFGDLAGATAELRRRRRPPPHFIVPVRGRQQQPYHRDVEERAQRKLFSESRTTWYIYIYIYTYEESARKRGKCGEANVECRKNGTPRRRRAKYFGTCVCVCVTTMAFCRGYYMRERCVYACRAELYKIT